MQYHALFFSKIGKDVAKLSSAAAVICALRVNNQLSRNFINIIYFIKMKIILRLPLTRKQLLSPVLHTASFIKRGK